MPKKKQTETQAEQSERFRRAVQELVDAGELSPTEAEERFEQALREMGGGARKGEDTSDSGA